MNATKNDAQVAVEIMHKDHELDAGLYNQFKMLRKEFEGTLPENWKWEDEIVNEHGATLSRISKPLTGVNILKEEDWP